MLLQELGQFSTGPDVHIVLNIVLNSDGKMLAVYQCLSASFKFHNSRKTYTFYGTCFCQALLIPLVCLRRINVISTYIVYLPLLNYQNVRN